MNKINITTARSLLLLLVITITNSCKKEMMSYHGNTGVYFAVQGGIDYMSDAQWPYQPSSTVAFDKYDTNEIDFPVKVMITGPVEDIDRYFNLEVNPDSTTAELNVHYTAVPKQVTVPAGATTAYVEVHLLRAADLQDQERTLGLKLLPNQYFDLSFPEWHALPELTAGPIVPEFDASMHTLHINDFMVQPAIWYGAISDAGLEGGRFGAFTRKKMELITQVTGITYAEFGSRETMPLIRTVFITNTMQVYLKKMYDAGTPVLEKDGRLMFMGDVPWRSYVGVPWVPGS